MTPSDLAERLRWCAEWRECEPDTLRAAANLIEAQSTVTLVANEHTGPTVESTRIVSGNPDAPAGPQDAGPRLPHLSEVRRQAIFGNVRTVEDERNQHIRDAYLAIARPTPTPAPGVGPMQHLDVAEEGPALTVRGTGDAIDVVREWMGIIKGIKAGKVYGTTPDGCIAEMSLSQGDLHRLAVGLTRTAEDERRDVLAFLATEGKTAAVAMPMPPAVSPSFLAHVHHMLSRGDHEGAAEIAAMRTAAEDFADPIAADANAAYERARQRATAQEGPQVGDTIAAIDVPRRSLVECSNHDLVVRLPSGDGWTIDGSGGPSPHGWPWEDGIEGAQVRVMATDIPADECWRVARMTPVEARDWLAMRIASENGIRIIARMAL